MLVEEETTLLPVRSDLTRMLSELAERRGVPLADYLDDTLRVIVESDYSATPTRPIGPDAPTEVMIRAYRGELH